MGLYDDLKWYALTEPEKTLAECVRDGKPCDFSNGKVFDPKERESWNGQPEIRGRVIAALLTGELKDKDGKNKIAPTHKGVILIGAQIPDGLDLSGASAMCPFGLLNCLATGTLDLGGTRLGLVGLSGGRIEGTDGTAINGDGFHSNGDLFLRGTVAVGEVRLLGADIGGDLYCDGAAFENAGQKAFIADGMKTGGVARFDKATAKGEFRLLGADIGGNLGCYGAAFENAGDKAFTADRMKTGGTARFEKATAKGEFLLLAVDIGGDLVFKKTAFDNDGGEAFNAQNANVEINFYWVGIEAPKGIVDLMHMRVGVLADDPKSWPEKGKLWLDGFEYSAIAPGSPTDAKARLNWLGRMPAGKYTPQPYRQLAKVLHQMGHETDARIISIARMDAYRGRRDITRRRMCWLWFIKWTAAYGYEPWRALIIAFWIVWFGWVIASDAFHYGAMHPVKERVYLDKCYVAYTSAACSTWYTAERRWASPIPLPKDYPEFNSVAYILDVFFPFVDLHQEVYWEPSGTHEWGWFYRLWLWFTIAAGWILSTIGIAAFTGIVKDKDD